MKVIVSHDVDHITVFEHNRDLILPKFIVRSFIEKFLGRISFSEFGCRFKDILKNKWQNLDEIAKFDVENELHSTFFFGVNSGVGLSYSLKDAECWIKRMLAKGCDVGVHGISFESCDNIKKEYEAFKSLSGLQEFGIRMHNLRNTENTTEMLNEAGYMFDSSIYKIANPFKVGNLWEFPLHLMEGYLFNKNGRWQKQSLEQVKEKTKAIIGKAEKENIKYFTLLFHDRYYSAGFKTWKQWYVWVIGHLKQQGFEFVNYNNAIQELEAAQCS